MKNKRVLAIAAIVLVAALMLGVYMMTRPDTAAGGKAITVTVIHSDSSESVFHYTTNEEYLGPVLETEKLVESQDGMINTVDGETADWNANQSYWALYVGEEYATVGANDLPIHDGDSFKWVYTIG